MNIYEVILDRMNRYHYIIVIISIVYVYITFDIDSFLLDNLLNSMIDYQFSRVGIVNRGEFLYRYEFFDIYIIISSFVVVLTSYVAYRYISNICATSYMFYMASTVLCIFAIFLMNSIYLYSDYRSSLVSNQVIDCIHSKKCAFNTEKYLFLSQLRGFADNYVAGGNVNVITDDLKKYDDLPQSLFQVQQILNRTVIPF